MAVGDEQGERRPACPRKTPKIPKSTQRLKAKQEQVLEHVYRLYDEGNCSIKQIASRLKVAYWKVRRILNGNVVDADVVFTRQAKHKRFDKLHQRARQAIEETIMNATQPLSIPEIQRQVRLRGGLRASKHLITDYVQSNLDVSYRKIKQITVHQNLQAQKLRRQFFAAKYIELLHAGRVIINVDESIISRTINRTRSWLPNGRRTFVAASKRLEQINIIAGVSSAGGLYYTVNRGRTNSYSFLLYICKLVEHLNATQPDWRQSTIIMLDNAHYHLSLLMKAKLRELRVPVIYLGPYQYEVAPVELFFAFVKSRDLNPLNSRIVTR